MPSLALRVLQHDRLLVAAALLAVTALSWTWLLGGAGTLEDMGGMLMPMSSGPWDAGHAGIMLGMWLAMMAAMMLPSATPMILLYTHIAGRRWSGMRAFAATGSFAAGYAVAWAGFSVLAVLLQYGLERASLLSPMMQTTSTVLAGVAFLGAGVYQWLPWKQACLRRCRSPLDFILTHWADGARGAFGMGLRHGGYCVGCCWALMLLLFVGGLMNLAWVGALAAFVLVEKLAPGGRWLGRAGGLALAGWGAWMLLSLG